MMRSVQSDMFADMEDQGVTLAMDVDDMDAMEMLGEAGGVFSGGSKLPDADFFNNFQDDFDDADIN